MGAHSRPGLFSRLFGRDNKIVIWTPPPPAAAAPPPARPVDGLTGLPDLAALSAALGRPRAEPAVLVLFDMDGFASYNERYGRPAGDEALRAIATTLEACAPAGAELFRAGGDRFAAIVASRPDEGEGVSDWARTALRALSPLPASAALVLIRAGYRPEAILRDAEMTLLALKEAGGSMSGIYGPHVDSWARSRRHEISAMARELEELRLENERLNQSMLADPRTGLANATAFEADHNQLDHRRRRTDDPYSVILAEIDYFDRLRAGQGEQVAGAVAAEVGAMVARTVRGSDRTYRLGEADFAVLLPGAQMREAVAASERVRIRVEKLALPHPDAPSGAVTMTLAAITAGFRHKSTKDVLVEAQDMLGSAAVKGRNRVLWPV